MSRSRPPGQHKSVRNPSRHAQSGTHRQLTRRRRTPVRLVALLSLAGIAGGAGVVIDRGTGSSGPGTEAAAPQETPTPSLRAVDAAPRPTMRRTDTTRESPKPPVVRRNQPRPSAPPAIPETGSGDLILATGTSAAVGAGPLTTYSVEVERELPLSTNAVATTIDRALADERGWTATGSHSLQRTDGPSDVRVVVTTPETTDELCAPLDTGGRLSCRNGDMVVLNAWRWVNGAPAFAEDLTNYRRYLISHEFGHALGNPHEDCPADGALAPVMMQQTKSVADCEPNPWPYPSN